MYKYIILLKVLASDTHTDVLLKDGEQLVIKKDNPQYEYCVEALTYALERNRPVAVIVAEGGLVVDVVRSRSGVVSGFNTNHDDRLGVMMMPLAGVYYLAKKHPAYERLRQLLIDSQQQKKQVDLFLRPGVPSDIMDVRLLK